MSTKLILTATLISVLFFVSKTSHDDKKIAWLDFAKQDSMIVIDKVSGAPFSIQSNFKKPEFVRGLKGEALRLDGYSTFTSGRIPERLPASFSISGWFALETFPTDTAGFFAVVDGESKNSIGASVDRFGKPMIAIQSRGNFTYVAGDEALEKFAWIYLVLNVDGSKISLCVNGSNVATTSLTPGTSYVNTVMGRDVREKFLDGLFPTSHLNGLMDEVVISSSVKSKDNIIAEFKSINTDEKPDLSIPDIRFKDDFNRPKYHLLPAANWTNETHGLIYYEGTYHIFNQKNGTNVFLGQINWGHFSSPDMIHWTEHVPALTPDLFYDEKGIWSGCVINDPNGVPAIIYTGRDGENNGINLAYPKDENLIGWTKYEDNPVVKKSPDQFQRRDMRDPFVWKDGATYYMIVGYGVVEKNTQKGSLLLYKSVDLKQWTFLHTFFTGDPETDDSGIFWEMPVLWKMGDRYVLLVNKVPEGPKPAVALYWVGEIHGEHFIPDKKIPQRLELINRLLSPSLAFDQKGRSVAIAIIPDEISAAAQLKQGWTHLYSIPREWTLRNGKIVQKPLPDLTVLRDKCVKIQEGSLNGRQLLIAGNLQVEVLVKLKLKNAQRVGLVLGKSQDNKEYTKVYCDIAAQKVIVDSRHSSANPDIPTDIRESAYTIDAEKEVTIHAFIDGSVAEVFLNDEAFTTRFFPAKESSNIIELFAEGGKAEITEASVWTLKPAKPVTDW